MAAKAAGARSGNTYYQVRWNPPAYRGRLASWFFWIVVALNLVAVAVFVSGIISAVPSTRNGIALAGALILFALLVYLALVLQGSVDQLKQFASHARRVTTPDHPTETLFYNVMGEELYHGTGFLPAPWGFSRECWKFAREITYEGEHEVQEVVLCVTITLTLRNFTAAQLVRICPKGPSYRYGAVNKYIVDEILEPALDTIKRRGFINRDIEPNLTAPWKVNVFAWPVSDRDYYRQRWGSDDIRP